MLTAVDVQDANLLIYSLKRKMAVDPSRTCMDVQSTYDYARIEAMSVNRDSCSQLVMQRMVEAQKACAPSTGSVFTFSTHTGFYIDPRSYQQFCLEKYNMALNFDGLPVVVASVVATSRASGTSSGTNNNSSETVDSGSKNSAVLMGIVVGVVALGALIVGGCWFKGRSKQRKEFSSGIDIPSVNTSPYQWFDGSDEAQATMERSQAQQADMSVRPPVFTVLGENQFTSEKKTQRMKDEGSLFDVYTSRAQTGASSRGPFTEQYDSHSVTIHRPNNDTSYASVPTRGIHGSIKEAAKADTHVSENLGSVVSVSPPAYKEFDEPDGERKV
ncbi:hypothetical protein BDR26DRAFT_313663 [Obelidium mucronatum]|nr:hypothetical protein BDR26DRAFT_313663 [Obelidium mucronatum]